MSKWVRKREKTEMAKRSLRSREMRWRDKELWEIVDERNIEEWWEGEKEIDGEKGEEW